MAKYVYPAVFTKEQGGYSVNFPDIERCYTSGATLAEAMEMASDVLCLVLFNREEKRAAIPVPSDLRIVEHTPSDFVSLVNCDTEQYRRHTNRKRKTDVSPEYRMSV